MLGTYNLICRISGKFKLSIVPTVMWEALRGWQICEEFKANATANYSGSDAKDVSKTYLYLTFTFFNFYVLLVGADMPYYTVLQYQMDIKEKNLEIGFLEIELRPPGLHNKWFYSLNHFITLNIYYTYNICKPTKYYMYNVIYFVYIYNFILYTMICNYI